MTRKIINDSFNPRTSPRHTNPTDEGAAVANQTRSKDKTPAIEPNQRSMALHKLRSIGWQRNLLMLSVTLDGDTASRLDIGPLPFVITRLRLRC